MMSGMWKRAGYALGVGAIVFLPPQSLSAQTLSGAIVFSTDTTGTISGGQIWNTQSGDGKFNLWLRQGGGFVNGPTDAGANIAIPLSSGTFTYAIYGEPGGSTGFDGLNLFFDGNNTAPGISAFGATQTTAAPSSFAPNSSVTLALDGNTQVTGAGATSFIDGTTTITLTNFTWAVPAVNNTDLVSAFSTGASGTNDFVGTFTLVVQTPVLTPEPGSLAILVGMGIAGAGFLSRRKR